jgi:hypothetical protein
MLKYPKPSRMKRRYKKASTPESALQTFADEYVAVKGIRCIRIPDGIFRYVNSPTNHIAAGFRLWFNKTFAAMPDCLLLKPFGRYLIALPMELKTTEGALHGKQKTSAKEENWIICRTVNEIIQAVNEFEEFKNEKTQCAKHHYEYYQCE